jgi:hypothetical protein
VTSSVPGAISGGGESKHEAEQREEKTDDTPTDKIGSWHPPARSLPSLIIAPNTFEENVAQVAQRAHFLLALAPAVVNSTVLEKPGEVAVSQLAQKWDSLLPQRSVRNSTAAGSAATTAAVAPGGIASGEQLQGPSDAGKDPTKQQAAGDTRDNGADLLRYLKLGHTAPPSILITLLARRQDRAKERAAGLACMTAAIRATSIPSAIADLVQWIRPALRGVSPVERHLELCEAYYRFDSTEESAPSERHDLSSLQAAANAIRAPSATPAHFMKDLAGVTRAMSERVQLAGISLYTELGELIRCCHNAQDAGNSHLGRALMWSWCLNFDEFSHPWMLRFGIIDLLRDLVSLDTLDTIRHRQMRQEDASTKYIFAEDMWTPIRVRDGLLNSSLSKWQVVNHMARVRMTEETKNNNAFMQSDELQQNFAFLETDTPQNIAAEHDFESLLVLYENFIEAIAGLKSAAKPKASFEAEEFTRKIAVAELKESQEVKARIARIARSESFVSVAGQLHTQILSYREMSSALDQALVVGESTIPLSKPRRPSDIGGCEAIRETAAALYRFLSVQLWMNRDTLDQSWKDVPVHCFEVQRRIFSLMEMELGRGCRLLQTSTSLLEAGEIEHVVFSHLLQCYIMSNTAAGTHYIGQQNMLQHLFTILRIGSPRTRCLCLRILRQVVPKLDPHRVVPSTKSWVPVSHLRSSSDPKALNALSAALLNIVGKCLLPVTEIHKKTSSPKSFKHAHTLRYQKSNVGTAGGTGNHSSFANLVGYGSGKSQCIFMSECVAFLRQMLHSVQSFEVGATVTAILENSSAVIDTLTDCAMKKEATDLQILRKEGPTLLQLRRIAAALSVCGAHLEYLRVGGNVCLPGGSVARLVAFDDDGQNVWLTFGEAVQSLPQLVPLTGLRPVEEVDLQQGIVPLTSGMISLFMKLADLDLVGMDSTRTVPGDPAINRTKQTDAQFWLSTLKMLGMRSLAHLMLHEPTAKKVHAAGAMRNLLQNALREAELPAYVELGHLEYQSRTLRKRVLEVSPDRHGTVWTTLQPNQDAEGTARRERELRIAESRKTVATEMFENFGKAMNFTVPMISHALKINGEDKSAAYNWCGIHGPAWKRSHMGGEDGGASKSNSEEDPMWEKAMEVSSNYGFPPKLTWHALRMFGGVETVSVQAAVEFMFGDGQQYIARLEKEEAKDQEPDSFPQQREQLVIENLLMFGVDPSLAKLAAKNSSDVESALDWISAHPGALEDEALRQSSALANDSSVSSASAEDANMSANHPDTGIKSLQEEADTSTSDGLQDDAALEELGSARNLLLESSSYVAGIAGPSSAEDDAAEDAGAGGESDPDMESIVAGSAEQSRRQGAAEAWVARLIPKRSDAASDAHVRGGLREMDMLPIVPGMLVVETQDAGEVGRLTHRVGTIVSGSDGKPMVTRQYSTSSSDRGDSRQLRVRYLNSQSGIAVQRRVSVNKLRYIKRLFGEEIDSIGALRSAASHAAAGLAVQYGRHAILSLLHHWPQECAFNLDLFENPQQLVDMVKMIAASEDGFASLGSDTSRPGQVGTSSANTLVADAMAILTAKLRKILKYESSSMDVSASLASVLVRECTDHVFKTTKIGDSEDCKTFESLHPYWARGLSDGGYGGPRGVDYRETVEFPGAKALRIRFDSRCASETRSSLTFYGGGGKTVVARLSGPPERWKSFVIHSERFVYRFEGRTDSHEPGWGYKFTVSPLLGLSWSRESQVLTEPSLEYACWILDFLLSNTPAQGEGDSSVINVRLAVHDPKVFEALANYLRSPGAPYKPRVVYLITQLLKSPGLFPEHNTPDLSKLDGVKTCVMKRCLQEQTRPGQMMLAEGLQQLVEMILVSREAKSFFAERAKNKATKDAGIKNITASSAEDGTSSVMSDRIFLNRVLKKDCSSNVVSRLSTALGNAQSQLEKIEKSRKNTAESSSRRKIHSSEQQSGTGVGGGESKHPGDDENDLLDLEAALVGTTGIIENLASDAEHLPTHLVARAYLLCNVGSSKDFTERKKKPEAEKMVNSFAEFCTSVHTWTREEDRQLTCFLNDQLESLSQKQYKGLREGRRGAVLSVELKVSSLALPETRTAKIESRYGRLMDRPIQDIRVRAAVVQSFNDQLAPVIPFLDLMAHESSDRIGARLKSIRHLVLMSVKTKLMDSALRSTQGNSGTSVTLDRYAAQQSKESGTISPDASQSCFVQVFHQLHGRVAPRNLRRPDRVFDAGWRGGLGEGGVDAGGPYREALTTVCTDLFCEDQLDLFIRSPNGKDEVGETRDRFVPNPEYTSPQAIKMYEFCGLWMGISFRTKASLPFQLPSMLWKVLVGQMTDLSDLSKIDFDCVQRLKRIRALGTKVEPDPGSTSRGGEEKKSRGANDDAATLSEAAESEFTAVWEGLAFNTRRSDSSLVDLIPGGSDIPVSYQRRNEYADAVEKYRLHEFDQQFAAIRRGFGTIVPLRLMPLFTWQEAEVLVCGTPEINIAALKMHTVYQGFSGADDPTVKTFWTIMEEWGNEERSRFIQFAWGRQRLPQPGAWTRNMKLSRLGGDGNQMPVSHTCFFHVEMPPYTSLEQARKMLGLTLKFGLGSMMLA